MATTTSEPLVRLIAPARGWLPIRFDEIWAYRELLYFLVWREIKVRYKQTALGVGWAAEGQGAGDGRCWAGSAGHQQNVVRN